VANYGTENTQQTDFPVDLIKSPGNNEKSFDWRFWLGIGTRIWSLPRRDLNAEQLHRKQTIGPSRIFLPKEMYVCVRAVLEAENDPLWITIGMTAR
jgi:hypothetical protein